jgi:all-trans-8'-apo-beta-carotenal 15,15'-oxygenase
VVIRLFVFLRGHAGSDVAIDNIDVYAVIIRGSRTASKGGLMRAAPAIASFTNDSQTKGAPPPDASLLWLRAFRSVEREHGFEDLRIDGRIPEGLRGTLYRNGPGLFASPDGKPYNHWFDGDGAVSAISLAGQTAQGAVRVVQSHGLTAERAAKKRLFQTYGTSVGRGVLDRLRIAKGKNNANTSVMVWKGRLFALMEAARPTELDPATLDTLGETDLDGLELTSFSAHPHRVRERRATYNFGVRYGRQTELDIVELPDDGPARRLARIPLAGATMIHDFIPTPNHLVFFAPPLRLRILRQLLQLGSYSENLAWTPSEGTEVIVVPIDNPTAVKRFVVEPFYQWHFANAFEQGSKLTVDVVAYDDFGSNEWLKRVPHGAPNLAFDGKLTRMELDLEKGALTRRVLWDGSCEFPRVGARVQGLASRFTYAAAMKSVEASRAGFFDRIVKVDATGGPARVWEAGAGCAVSEPVFVKAREVKSSDAAEDAGHLLVQVYDGHTDESSMAILDASELERGPVARVFMGHALPFPFHGFWEPARQPA